jgi:hypothetical protein
MLIILRMGLYRAAFAIDRHKVFTYATQCYSQDILAFSIKATDSSIGGDER